jgi:hypothetical protein
MVKLNQYFLTFLIVAVIILAINYGVALSMHIIIARISDVGIYRVGYVALLVGIPTLITVFGEAFIYTLIFRSIILRRGLGNARLILKHVSMALIPILILICPYFVTGVGGVVAEGMFYEATVAIVTVWSAVLALFTFFVYPVYIPYTSFAVAACLDSKELTCTYRSMRRFKQLVLNVIATAIVTFIILSLIARILKTVAPELDTPLLPIPEASPYQPWKYRWVQLLGATQQRYLNLVLDPINYILFVYIFKWLSRKRLKQLISL